MMTQISTLVMLIASLGSLGHETEIDPLKYRNTTAAQTVWHAAQESTTLRATTYRGRPVLQLGSVPENGKPASRISMDRDLKVNLSSPSLFHLDVKLSEIPAGERISLYLRSGKGWYTAGLNIPSNKWERITFRRENFAIEGTPTGWDKIDGIRLAIWKGENRAPKILLRNFSASSNLIAVVVPDDKKRKNQTAFQVAESFENFLGDYNIEIDRITESSLQVGALGKRRLAILPHNPQLSQPGCEVLNRFMEKKGKLFVCYGIPHGISQTFGIARGTHYRPKNSEPKFASIRFKDIEIDGLPSKVTQASWNVNAGKPIGHGAKSIANWFDDSGKPMNVSAFIESERGLFFSHVPIADDPENKRLMFVSLLAKLEPKLWSEIVFHALNESSQIGDCPDEQALKQRIRKTRGSQGLRELEAADRKLSQITDLLKTGKGYQALVAFYQSRKIREEAFLKGMKSKKVEGRAFWEHAGTGAYPGDWERSMKELSEAGFNMIIPNMLWGDAAHYASDVLDRSPVYEKHGDQVEQCLAAAKKYDIEVHVWKVNFRCSRYGTKEFLERMRKEGRLQRDVEGIEQPWLNPAHPKNRELEIQSLLEVVRKYDVAGIHFDYIRYPRASYSFDDYSRNLFEKTRRLQVKNWPKDCYRGGILEKEYTDFRCEQITKLVEAVSSQAKKIKPSIKISAAVFRDQPSARNTVAQDWPLWVKKGYLDFLCPMDYTGDDKQYVKWIKNQKELINGKCLLYPGIGASSSRSTLPADRVAGQINITRELGADGYTIFNFNEATANRVLPGLKLGAGKTKAKPPHRR